ncbi:MAG: Hsp70 family protein [Synechococcaceae cyanobacterium SM2_3_1]|nr:Hsp70 family protein [Synechococcaceae cyanobacterium SM2_3_1]
MTTVAIDFGTTNTVVSVWDPVHDCPKTLFFPALSRSFEAVHTTVHVIPSQLFIASPSQIVVGEEIRAQRLAASQPQRWFHSFKRDLVADFVPPPRQLDGHVYTPETVAELFLQQIFQVLLIAKIQPAELIMTAPVGAFERYLDWIQDVVERHNLPPVRFVDEATAAALGYAVNQPGAQILVVDFGGGTLDLSLVRTTPPTPGESRWQCEVIAKSDAFVGGMDIDTWIGEYYLKLLGVTRSQIGELGWQNLLEIAERMKIQLSSQEQVGESWFDDETLMAHELLLTRDNFDQILESQQLLAQVQQCLDDVVLMAQHRGVLRSEIDQVILVGGTSQIPAVQSLIMGYFGPQRVQSDRPFEAVAHGALRVGQYLQIQDVLHHSYALRLWDPHAHAHVLISLFEKGIPYPCRGEEPLILQVAHDDQSEIRLDIGEVAETSQAEVFYDEQGRMTSRRLSRQTDFRSISRNPEAQWQTALAPPGRVGMDRLELRVEINEQRQLLVTLRDLETGTILTERRTLATLE